MNIYSIYKATNLINGKVYIGFASNFKKRINQHKSTYKRKNYVFYEAIAKYGWDNFEWEIIYQSKDKDYTKNIMENYFIEEYRTYLGFNDCKGYNSSLGGEGNSGNILSEETKNKISISSKNIIKSEQWKNNISKSLKGKNTWTKGSKLSEEHKSKIGQANKISLKGRIPTWHIGKKLPDEVRKKIAESHKKLKVTCIHCGKVGDPRNMARWHNQNCRLKNDK